MGRWKRSAAVRAGAGLGLVAACAVGLALTGCQGFTRQAQAFYYQHTATGPKWQSLAQQWRPPASTDLNTLFPSRAADITLTTRDNMGPMDLGIQTAGHGAYIGSGGSMDAYATPASWSTAQADFQAVAAHVKTESGGGVSGPYYFSFVLQPRGPNGRPGRPVKETGALLEFTSGQGGYRGTLWWEYNWLFLAQTNGSGDPDSFLRGYLNSIGSGEGTPFGIPVPGKIRR